MKLFVCLTNSILIYYHNQAQVSMIKHFTLVYFNLNDVRYLSLKKDPALMYQYLHDIYMIHFYILMYPPYTGNQWTLFFFALKCFRQIKENCIGKNITILLTLFWNLAFNRWSLHFSPKEESVIVFRSEAVIIILSFGDRFLTIVFWGWGVSITSQWSAPTGIRIDGIEKFVSSRRGNSCCLLRLRDFLQTWQGLLSFTATKCSSLALIMLMI